MSRKAKKKTLERLRENAKRGVLQFYETSNKIDKTKQPMRSLYSVANRTIGSLVTYIIELEDYRLEYDEAWGELLERVRAKEPSYRV